MTTNYTAVLYLRRSRVAVHVGELELSLGASTLREGSVADDVAEGLARVGIDALVFQMLGVFGFEICAFLGAGSECGVGRASCLDEMKLEKKSTYRSGSYCAKT